MSWISVKERLPQENKYVLARYNGGNWHDKDDQENVNCVVVKLEKGISLAEREKMKNGEIPDTNEFVWCGSGELSERKRSSLYRSEDERSNNKMPYCWRAFGHTFFGQDISYWMPIEPLQEG